MTVSNSFVQCYYQVRNNLVWYQYSANNTVGGTLSFAIYYTLPFNMVASDQGSGTNQTVSAGAGQHSNGGIATLRFDFQSANLMSARNYGGNYGAGTTWHDFAVHYPIA